MKKNRVCLVTTKYPDGNSSPWLTNELACSLENRGYKMTVVALSWLESDPPSSVSMRNGIKEIRVKIPVFFYKKNFVFTVLKLLVFPLFTIRAVLRNVDGCDFLITNTPCITMLGSAWFFKKWFKSKTFLILWDFFPFYLKDLGAVRNAHFFKVLHFVESAMYKSFDRIGCMTQKNVDFLRDKYNYDFLERVSLLPIWTDVKHDGDFYHSLNVGPNYSLPDNKVLAIYGGAISVVQELENLLNLAKMASSLPVHFVIVGTGTEANKISELAKLLSLNNITFIPPVSRVEYGHLLAVCDIGLIFLSHKLTVPSFPSKSLDYFKYSKPILAGIDSFTDFGTVLENEACAGFAVIANQTELLYDRLKKLVDDKELRASFGRSGRKYFERTFDVDKVCEIIIGDLRG